MKNYTVVNRETGTVLDYFETYEEAQSRLSEYEYQDSKDGIFVENFYEII